MKEQTRKIQYFLFSQDFSDGLRITLSVLIPALLFAQFGQLETGLTLSEGALCVSIIDTPGPVLHKRNGMLLGNLCIFVVALLTGFARLHVVTMGLEVLALSFLFTMVQVYGNRASALGSAALLIMILTMDKPLEAPQVLTHALLVLAGGVWYMLLALAFFEVRPYRPAQQALGECIHAIAQFMKVKAAFYRTDTDLEEDYRRLVAQQVIVNEKQDAVREVLFKSRQVIKESTNTSRRLVLTFVDVVDLYEHITATYYDYAALRERFGRSGVLDDVAELIQVMANELDHIGVAIQSNRPYKTQINLSTPLERFKARIDATADEDGNNLVLKKILINLRNLTQRVNDILNYFNAKEVAKEIGSYDLEYSRFVSHQDYSPKVLADNFTFSSAVFRHSIRMVLACGVGFLVAKLLFAGHHSYWIVMTVAYMLKPAFSFTKQRNYERVIGTLGGGAIAIFFLVLVHDKTVQFIVLLFFMVMAYSFQRKNYIVYVTFMTPFILILFSFLGVGYLTIAEERVKDTVIGCVIAFAAGYLLFPKWESEHLTDFMRDVIRANVKYLQKLAETLAGKSIHITDYKLARKEVYVSSANLAAAFQRMLSEPKSKQRNSKEVHQFVVLNHILSSNIATITSTMMAKNAPSAYPTEDLRAVRRSLKSLNNSLKKLDPQYAEPAAEAAASASEGRQKTEPSADDRLLMEQLEFIQKVSSDIGKVTEAVVA
ncbi:FUSC family membrane protein [Hymenobacter sp. BT491]|uniref:FUSC family membrane protein n=1 Tax=Hymenobacter sp. BT491 TaxID=2766779 RepID=UPI001653DFE8|nr:FUSC family membrane protein [Hymenobacter sp. BT491]MBC6990804.1 FUSC family protein [Hymenobacter sp. BT491]